MAQMDHRLELDTLLRNILGSEHVYFQPPENVRMQYPALVYDRARIDNTSADNVIYKQDNMYSIMAIYDDPDSDLPDKLSVIPRIRYDRTYKADNLYHTTFSLFWH